MSTISQDQLNSVGSLVRLIEVLQEVNILSPDAKNNETSIDDNNGGRIML